MPFAIIATTPPGFPGVGVIRSAHAAGFDGAVLLDNCSPAEQEALLADLAVSQTAFSVCVSILTPALRALLASSPGCRRVILSSADFAGIERDIAVAKALGLPVFVEVTSLEEARAAQACGAGGLIAKGNESGGAVGEETTLVLLQHLLASDTTLPVFARGGVGLRTAAACMAAGAAGVVLDWQLALCEESELPEAVKARVATMDGGETAILGQDAGTRYRVYARPGEAAYFELKDLDGTCATLAERQAWVDQVKQRAAAQQLLLIGQDAAFARPLAEEFRTVGAVCRAIQSEAARQCRVAHRLDILREGGPLAEAHGTRYAIAQGPMTRVSDQAMFAAAVAEGGGLPFLALALMHAKEVEALLEETQQALAGRPWGVGILGFVPKELRDEQLEAVKKYRPPFAVIAGGRPDQAKALEKDGTRTYLHVPSPALLESFLESGARRFIFEGRECGGHVGPRSSFVLWELMIAVILKHLKESNAASRADEYCVLFAGGIHDALSAAMVSAVAAPLAERGVRVGALMGTAYLFTHEAVSSGAIQPGFQQEVIDCSETLLLETGVGHSTRCASTAFGRFFAEEKLRLAREGRSKDEIREALENLNLGRLRIAAKGIRRDDAGADGRSAYVQVDDSEQRREGMFMVGQVAALKRDVLSIAELHAGVSRAAEVLAKFAPSQKERASSARRGCDIAVVGMACAFPQAKNPDQFWQNILNKTVTIREIPKERWDSELYFDGDRQARDRIYSRWGGFLDDFPFDPVRYGMPPNTIKSIEPLQLMVLEIVRAALADAGFLDRPFDRERTAVVLGTGGGVGELGLCYGFRSMVPHFLTHSGQTAEDAVELIDQLEGHLPQWTEDSFAGLLLNVAAGRVSNRFDLGGANYIVDAACATSLAAVRLAINELESGASDIAIAAAADTMQSPFAYLCFSKTQALSATGQCRTFDETADGIVISEGVAAAVLKRLEDAERDGDRIYAVIKGIGASSDGKDKGLTAPRPAGQIRALRRAYEKAGVEPETVGLIEAHGTGTVAGDRAEVEALKTFFKAEGAEQQACALGSVKSMIGHTKCAAGFAGMIKAAFALQSKVLPPTTGVTKPNANLADGPLYLNTQPRPWLKGLDDSPRRAGVSAFGFGGTNFHAVLEEYDPQEAAGKRQPPSVEWPAELFLWRGRTPQEILDSAGNIRKAIQEGAQPRLCDLAAAVYWEKGRGSGPCCLAIVATSIDDLFSKIDAAKPAMDGGSSLRDPRGIYYSPAVSDPGKIAFLFPGQGSQRVNMLADLAIAFPSVRATFEQADAGLGHKLGKTLSQFIFPPPAFSEQEADAREAALKDTIVAQPALGAAGLAMNRLLADFGIYPDFAAGHSYGEFVALSAAGVIAPDDLTRISEMRGRLILEAAREDPGSMAAISGGESVAKDLIAQISGVCIANLNAPQQTVVSGTRDGIAKVLAEAKQRGIAAREIPVACAFHSPLVAAAGPRLEGALNEIQMHAPRIPVYSNTTAAPHSAEPSRIRTQLGEHLAQPVRFAGEMVAIYEAGARTFIEVGPGKVLTGLAAAAFEGKSVQTIHTDQPGRNGLLQLEHALAQLAASGVSFYAWRLFEGRVQQKLHLDKLVKETRPVPPSPTTWTITAGRAVPPASVQAASAPRVAEKPAPPRKEKPAALPTPKPQPAAPLTPVVAEPERTTVMASNGNSSMNATLESVMRSHHQLMSKFLETHRSVMAGFLGGGAAIPQEIPATAAMPAVVTAPAPRAPAPRPVPQSAPAPVPQPVTAALATPVPPPAPPAPAAAPVPAGLTLEAVTERVLELVSGLTGYPAQMLNLDLNLEADLGIDSIKRVEIFAALQSASLVPAGDEGHVEALSALKTLRAICEWVHAQAGGDNVAAAAPAVAAPVLTLEAVTARVLELVSGLTGYPAEMLNLDLNLEADLGIDSIKRVEIFAALQNASLVPADDEGHVEALSALKTLRAICEWVHAQAAGGSSSAAEPKPKEGAASAFGAPVPAAAAAPAIESKPATLTRMIVTAVDAPLPKSSSALSVAGSLLITDDGRGIAAKLSERLEQLGIKSRVIKADKPNQWIERVRSEGDRVAGLVHLAPLAQWPHDADFHARLEIELRALFHLARGLEQDLRTHGEATVITATRLGGAFAHEPDASTDFWPGSGAAVGLLKTLAREWPEVHCKALDFEAEAEADEIAGAIIDEIGARDSAIEIGYRDGRRLTLCSTPSVLEPHGKGLELGSESVVLVTGGARGVTAEIAIELAQRSHCRLVLVGKSPMPEEPEPKEIAAIADSRQLKSAVIAMLSRNGQAPSPASVERELNRIQRERDMRATLTAIAKAGSACEYHAVDVSDAAAFGALIDSLYDRFGVLDGVVHGAGIIEDKLIAEKSVESFDRVLAPKIVGALTLARKLRPEKLRFLAFFSSVSARYGNRGQGDYAAANEVLNKLAAWLKTRWPARVVSIDWGPWKTQNGMVSAELAARFEKAGVQMVFPETGRAAFVDELAYGPAENAEVILGGPLPQHAPAQGPSRSTRRLPLLDQGSRVKNESNGNLALIVEASAADHIYLLDHQLDGKPVLPMAMAMELLAEAAVSHRPDLHLASVGELQVLQGLVFQGQESRILHVSGTNGVSSSQDPVIVPLELHSGEGARRLHYRAKAELRSALPEAKPSARLKLRNPKPLPITLEEAHAQWLFHGPRFAGIARVEALGENGIIGCLRPSSPSGFFTWSPQGQWLIDPTVIDSGLQLIILWARTHMDQTPLPSRLGKYHHFGLAAGNPTELCCEVEIRRIPGAPQLSNELKFFDQNGNLVGWLEGMEATCSQALNRLGRPAAASVGD